MRVLGIEMPSGPPEPAEPADFDDGDRCTWSGIDVAELRHGPRPSSLPPNATVDQVQSYQIGQIARAQAALGETLQVLRARLELLELAAVGASERAGKSGRRSSLLLALLALATAVAPEIVRLL